jgi:hypothetical protein
MPCVGVDKHGAGDVDKQRILLTMAGVISGCALFVGVTVHYNIQENIRLMQGSMRHQVTVTDVLKTLVMYIQVGAAGEASAMA